MVKKSEQGGRCCTPEDWGSLTVRQAALSSLPGCLFSHRRFGEVIIKEENDGIESEVMQS